MSPDKSLLTSEVSQIMQRSMAGILISSALFLSGNVPSAWAGTQGSIPKGEAGTPYGYLEFLPEAYTGSTNRLPLVIFFHGKGEGGDGSEGALEALKRHGPPKILQNENSADSIYKLIEQNNAIVLSPQFPKSADGAWWTGQGIRDYLNFVLFKSEYVSRIDMSRIYLTGVSAGSAGIYDYMNTQAHAYKKAAHLVMAPRGNIECAGRAAGAYVPTWALTAVGDSSSSATTAMDRIVAHIQGTNPSNVKANYSNLEASQIHTANYSLASKWLWTSGTDASSGYNPKVTLYPGNAHETWIASYKNAEVWKWLFARKKNLADSSVPTLSIKAPSSAATYSTTQATVNLAGTAGDNTGVNRVSWSDDRGGCGYAKGTSSWTIQNVPLRVGTNSITVTAFDATGNPVAKKIVVTRTE